MSNEKTISGLTQLLSKYTWFDSVGVDKFGKLVVYVKQSTLEVMNSIPDSFENKRVVWQYASSKSENVSAKYSTVYKPEPYCAPVVANTVSSLSKYIRDTIVNLPEVDLDKELDVNFLISELDRLEKIVGSRKLQDIFYEVHDGKNAVTDLKNKFPEVYDDVLDLYEEFGFDIIYNELDG